MDHDFLLEWLSERQSGSWADFRSGHDHLVAADPAGAMGANQRPTWTAYVLSALGHVEVDWRARRWSACAPAVVNLPAAGGTAILVGARPRMLARRMQEFFDDEAVTDIDWVSHATRAGPAVVYVQYGSEAELVRFASHVGARYVGYAADTISARLPAVVGLVESARVRALPPSFQLERFDPARLQWVDADLVAANGLYRYTVHGLYEHRLVRGGVAREVDRETGVWAELATASVNPLRYSHSTVNGTLSVPGVTRLPLLQTRAAVLCSGLPPVDDADRTTVSYHNVPRLIANRIAKSLGQPPVST